MLSSRGVRRNSFNIIGLAWRPETGSRTEGEADSAYEVNAPASAAMIWGHGPHEQIEPPAPQGCRDRCGGGGNRGAARRLLLGDLSARLHRARRGTGAESHRIDARTGSDRARHAVNGGDGERRGVLLHFPACRAAHWLHAAASHRPA